MLRPILIAIALTLLFGLGTQLWGDFTKNEKFTFLRGLRFWGIAFSAALVVLFVITQLF